MSSKVSLRTGLVTESLNGELVVLDSAGGVVHRLSGPAQRVVQLVAEGVTELPTDLSDAVDHLVELGILVAHGMSRRDMLRTGTAAAVGIVTLVLPAAAAASSGGGGDGVNTFSDGQITPTGTFDAPTLTNTAVGNGSASFSFASDPGASFKLLYRESGAPLYSIAYSGSLTTATVIGLTNGTTYQFLLQATVAGLSQNSNVVTATPNIPVPGIPVDIGHVTSTSSADITWSAGEGETPVSYTVRYRRHTTPTPLWTEVTGITDTSLTLSGLTAGYTYDVEIVAVGSEQSSAAATYSFTTLNTPGAPTSIAASTTGTQITVTWSAPASGGSVSGYKIRYKLHSDASWSAWSADLGIAYTSTVSGLTAGAEYDFEVVAWNSDGSGPAASVSKTVLNPPAVPTSVGATAGVTSFVATWSAPASGGAPSSYTLKYRLTSDPDVAGSYTTVTSVTSPYTVSSLVAGAGYTVQVFAVNADGVSAAASTTVTVLNPPGAVTNVAVVAGVTSGSANVSWTAPASGGAVASYTLRYRIGSGSWTTTTDISGTAFSVSGLSAGSTYSFEVWALNADGSGTAGTKSYTVINPPYPPINFMSDEMLSADGTRVASSLTWDPNPLGGTPTSYTIRYKLSSSATWTEVASLLTDSYFIEDLTAGTNYDFQVKAVNADGSSDWTALVGESMPMPTPQPPVTDVKTTATSALITVDNVSGYTYESKLDAGSWTTRAAGSTFTVTGLSSSSHTITVRKTKSGAPTYTSTVTVTKQNKTYGPTSTVTTLTLASATPVQSVGFTLIGACGGGGGTDSGKSGGNTTNPGKLVGSLTVAGGDVLTIVPGYGGKNGANGASNSGGGAGGNNLLSGYDGGTGGNAGSSGSSGAGGGGGAATVLRRTRSGTDVDTVAYGSGGGGGASQRSNGGNSYSGTMAAVGTTTGGNGSQPGGDGGGSGAGGGGYRAGASNGTVNETWYDGFLNMTRHDESYGLGGSPGTNYPTTSTGPVTVDSAGSNSTFSNGTNGSIVLTYYEVNSITQS